MIKKIGIIYGITYTLVPGAPIAEVVDGGSFTTTRYFCDLSEFTSVRLISNIHSGGFFDSQLWVQAALNGIPPFQDLTSPIFTFPSVGTTAASAWASVPLGLRNTNVLIRLVTFGGNGASVLRFSGVELQFD